MAGGTVKLPGQICGVVRLCLLAFSILGNEDGEIS